MTIDEATTILSEYNGLTFAEGDMHMLTDTITMRYCTFGPNQFDVMTAEEFTGFVTGLIKDRPPIAGFCSTCGSGYHKGHSKDGECLECYYYEETT